MAKNACATFHKRVISGDTGRMEEMLTTQAHTLDLIFNNLLAAPLPTCKRDTCPPQKPTCGWL